MTKFWFRNLCQEQQHFDLQKVTIATKNAITSVSELSDNNESILLCDIFPPMIVLLYVQENMQPTHISLLGPRKNFIV